MKPKTILALLLCLWYLSADAQTGKFYNTDKQLSSSMINRIYQDNYGRIWIGTYNGINVYDGYQFHIYKRDKNNGLKSNFINTIVQTRDGRLFIGLNNGLQVYDNNHFRSIELLDKNNQNVSCYVTCICQTWNGTVYVSTSGRGLFKLINGRTARQMACFGLMFDYVQRIIEDGSGALLVMTQDKGLFSVKGRTCRKINVSGAPDNSFMDVCRDRKGTVYVSNINGGLFRLNARSGKLEHVAASGNLPIVALYVGKRGEILLGTNGNGLYIYNPATDILTPNTFFSNEVDLSHGKVYSILEDNSGNVWMGLLQKGVFMQPFRQPNFGYVGYKNGSRNSIGDACVMCTWYGKDGTLWVATDNNGLYAIGSGNRLLRHFAPSKGVSSIPATVLGITEDLSGRLWVGSFLEGCGWVDRQSGAYHRLPCTYGKASSVFDIAVDRNDVLWMGTMGAGLRCVDLKTNKMKVYRSSTRGGNVLNNDYIAQLCLSNDGRRLYVGTTMGLCCMDLVTNSWLSVFGKNHIINDEAVSAIREDCRGNVWVGTNEGLYRVSLRNRHIRKFTVDDGLVDNSIASIEVDRSNRVWVSTSHGMSCLNAKNLKFTNYYVDDGLQNNEFSEGVSCHNDHGVMTFGGIGGLTVFQPMNVRQMTKHLSVYLTNVNISGEMLVAGMKSGHYVTTDTTVIDTKTLNLGYQDNSFSLFVSTLTFDNPERIVYMYSINGEQWVKLPQGKNEITFSHLPAGTYYFRIMAVDNNAVSSVRELTVIVHPVWFFSLWAKFFYALVAGLLIVWYLKMRRRKIQDYLRLQEHIHAEELSESKLRFFMNISHEIRTPMTLIVAPLLALMKEDHDVHRQGAYEIIKRNAERILHLINQMMDLRKIDKGQMVMRMKETNIIEFVTDVYSLFESQAKMKNIRFEFLHADADIPVWIDRGNFDKVLMNVLSNAFKFTRTGGEIIISVQKDEDTVSISVSDDGEKIPEDKLDKIFERFYQTVSVTNDRQAGTGIGLDLTRSLVELHHGTIKAHNNENGSGCTFVVTLPLGCAHLKPEEMLDDGGNNDETLYGIDIDEEAPVPEEHEDAPEHVVYNKKRPMIVVAEDDADIREYLRKELSGDYRIIDCPDGRQALNVILREKPEMVISDIMMPEMDGNTLCAKIKSNVNTNQIPVILLTAKNREEDELEGLETGADAYIMKPFNMDILRRTIINLMNVRNTLRNKFSGNESQDENVDIVQVKSPDEKLLERVMAVINANLSNMDLNIDMIAGEVGISRVHLHRKMKELTNQTPHDFIRNIRLKQAANLLTNQHQNVTEVMYACGFSNAASFSTMFKNMYGMSPREYMKEHAERTGDA